MKYLLLLASIVLAIIGQFSLKKGINTSSLTVDIPSIVKTLLTPLVFFGFFAYGISSIIWLFVLQKFPLSVAYPALSLTYIAIVFLSIMFLKEPFTYNKLAGVTFIIIGVFFLFK